MPYFPPRGGSGGGGVVPMPSSWRHFGHSWSDGGWDDAPLETPTGALRRGTETGIAERLAGMLHIAPRYFENHSIAGTSLMDPISGAGMYLNLTNKAHTRNIWPWAVHHGTDGFTWGVNDITTRAITGMLSTGWPTQSAMWREVWKHAWRSVIQRSIAGGIFPAERAIPTNMSDPTTGYHPGIVYGGPGGGGWTFTPSLESTGTGYWRTSTTGATVTITVPVDYDTGYLAFRHWVPGAYYPGATTIYGADGTGPYGSGPAVPQASLPAVVVGAAASETFVAPTNVTIATSGVTSVVQDCRILKDRRATNLLMTGMMTLVNRVAAPITPGTARTVTITVGTMPAGGGFYGFDSWDVEAPVFRRPAGPVVGNIASPAWWPPPANFLGINTWAAMEATAIAFSDDIATVCAEWADPGICVADLRTAAIGHELEYGVLYPAGVTPATGGGLGTAPTLGGDGTHPHEVGARLFAGAYVDALAKVALPSYRYASTFDPHLSGERR